MFDSERNNEIFIMRMKQSSIDSIAKKYGISKQAVSNILAMMIPYVERVVFRMASTGNNPFEQEDILIKDIREMKKLHDKKDKTIQTLIEKNKKLEDALELYKCSSVEKQDELNSRIKNLLKRLSGKLEPEIKIYKQEAKEWKQKYHLLLTEKRNHRPVSQSALYNKKV